MGLFRRVLDWWNDPGDPCPFCNWVDETPCGRHKREHMDRTPLGWSRYGASVEFVKAPGARVIDAYSDGYVIKSYEGRESIHLNMNFYTIDEAVAKAESYLQRPVTKSELRAAARAKKHAEEPYE